MQFGKLVEIIASTIVVPAINSLINLSRIIAASSPITAALTAQFIPGGGGPPTNYPMDKGRDVIGELSVGRFNDNNPNTHMQRRRKT